MSISSKDIKLLWGRSGNRCAICRKELSQDKATVQSAFPLGEQAHIVAEEVDGPRGKSSLPLEERNSHFNLILLCPTCHTIIDKNEDDYSIERLFIIKAKHESWVRETLAEQMQETKIDVEPVYLLIATVTELRPLLWWLHNRVPANNAKGFFKAWGELLRHDDILFKNMPSPLTTGLENLVRPLISGEFLEGRGDTLIYFANKSYGRHFRDRGIQWNNVMEQEYLHNLDHEEIMHHTDNNCRSALQILQTIDEYESACLRITLLILRYWRSSLNANAYIDIPEATIREFHGLINYCCRKELNFELPDHVDEKRVDILRRYCHGEWSD